MRRRTEPSAGRGARARAAVLAVAGLSALATLYPPGTAAEARAQAVATAPRPRPDTGRVRDEARDAQRAFERLRRRHFPRGWLAGGRCDEIVGRFCLDFGEDDGWSPTPEDEEVRAARRRLLERLDRAAALVPADPWILGQRVRYRVEDGRAAEAARLARACGEVRRSWCATLLGFALHAGGRHLEAEAAFERALAALPEAERCRWVDLRLVLRGSGRDRYDALPCAARRAFDEVFWHLADPLWSAAGNERRSEHLARQVWDRLQEDAASGYGVAWGRDLREILLRYGWPRGWDRATRRFPGVRTEATIQSHRDPDAQQWAPPAEWVWGARVEAGAWELDAERPRSGWAPPYGPLRPLPHQLARFSRGERTVVVASFVPDDSLGACDLEAHLFLASGRAVLARGAALPATPGGSRPRRAEARLPDPGRGGRAFVGVEARCVDRKGAARARYELDPLPGAGGLSDLLLLEPGDSLPGTLEAAARRARGSSVVRPGDTLAVFWEWYAAGRVPGPAAVTLSISREGKSFWRKAVEWIGLAEERGESVGLRWLEPLEPVEDGVAARAVTLALPDLPEGRYRLELAVRPARGPAATRSRELVVRR